MRHAVPVRPVPTGSAAPLPDRPDEGPAAGPRTLCVDCGGSGLKASVLDAAGTMLAPRVRVPTPYPLPPQRFAAELRALADGLPAYDRVTVGMPGVVRGGRVVATPHYVTEAGPFTPVRPDLLEAWRGLDVAALLGRALGAPTLVVNDAQVQGAAVVSGRGFEAVLTLGTGLGLALFDEGRLLPHLEMSHAPFRKGETYDQQLGDLARRRVGGAKWNRRVRRALDALRPVLQADRYYVGGGGARYVDTDLGEDVTLVDNRAGILGGVALWGTGPLAAPPGPRLVGHGRPAQPQEATDEVARVSPPSASAPSRA